MTENRTLMIVLGAIAVIIVALVIYFFTGEEEAPAPARPVELPAPEPEPVPVPEPAPAPVPEPEPVPAPQREEPEEPAFVLPRLENSDPLVRDGVSSLTRHEGIRTWLDRDELVRKFVVVTSGLAGGNVPRKPVADLAPKAPFKAKPINDKVFVMDEASYRRYDRIAAIATSVDTQRAAEFYELVRPLLQEAYEELGYTGKNFDDVVFSAIGRLLETPVITDPIYLIQPGVMYEYQDEKLESLSAAQKQLIRMGPENTRAIQAKLSEFALELRSILEDGQP